MNPLELIHDSWKPVLGLLNQEPLLQLNEKILPNCSYQPKKQDIFRALQMPLKDIKVVILGQDPYIMPGQANGFAFAVESDVKVPPSLEIIFQEIRQESNNDPFTDRTLEHWTEQGVLLLNTALTVETGRPGSHLRYWETFTQRIVNFISWENPCIWLLWGRQAQSFTTWMPRKTMFEVKKGYDRELIEQIPMNGSWNYLLRAAHPAAEKHNPGGNAGFLGCDHFYLTNRILAKKGQAEINW